MILSKPNREGKWEEKDEEMRPVLRYPPPPVMSFVCNNRDIERSVFVYKSPQTFLFTFIRLILQWKLLISADLFCCLAVWTNWSSFGERLAHCWFCGYNFFMTDCFIRHIDGAWIVSGYKVCDLQKGFLVVKECFYSVLIKFESCFCSLHHIQRL